MVEKKPQKTKTQNDYISDSDTSEDEVSPHLRTSQEERLYGTVKGSAQATQAALAHITISSLRMSWKPSQRKTNHK